MLLRGSGGVSSVLSIDEQKVKMALIVPGGVLTLNDVLVITTEVTNTQAAVVE